jgi:hypothetical protein
MFQFSQEEMPEPLPGARQSGLDGFLGRLVLPGNLVDGAMTEVFEFDQSALCGREAAQASL